MRRILGCILATLGLFVLLYGTSFLFADDGTTCTGGDPYGYNCAAGSAALEHYVMTVGIALVCTGLLLGVVPGILLAAWPRRVRPDAGSS